MGCANSKIDDLPAVYLCRERCYSLDEAVRLRYSLSNQHLSYFLTLSSLSHSFPSFFPPLTHPDPPSSPPKPHHPPTASSSAAPGPLRTSRSGSHIYFDGSDSDSDSDLDHTHHDYNDIESLHVHYDDNVPAFQHFPGDVDLPPGLGGFLGQGGFFHLNYMRNKASTPSVIIEQHPVSYRTVQLGEASSSSSRMPLPGYPPYPYLSSSSNHGNTVVGGGGGAYHNYSYPGDGNDGVSSGYYGPGQSYEAPAKPPPPPPSPPRVSAWDFLNPFESYEKYYPAYTPRGDSKELREEEGIPDLEDEHEVVKEVHGNQKFVNLGKNHNNARKGIVVGEEDDKDGEDDENELHRKVDREASMYQARPSVVSIGNDKGNDDRPEYEVHVVDKKVVDGEGQSGQGGGGAARGSRSVAEALTEIEVQFRRASECGSEVARMLEVGKLPYNRKHRVAKSTHMALNGSASKGALPSASAEDADQAQADEEEQLGMKSGNLSSTLQKLYLWEKKLCSEVKAEERMRVAHDRNVQKLKRLDERGAEAHKVDATRALIRNLSTKLKMAIQVVDRISVTVNKIRDEELWPQINELIEGLMRMWKSLHDCHRDQCLAVKESKSLGSILSLKKLGDDHLEVTLQFQRELIDWTFGFANWASTQKGFVGALNNWLLKCLLDEPEDTPDGRVPFSPGRIGAPPIFVICHQWSRSMEKISEKEVVSSMYTFATGVLQFWDRGKLEMHNRSTGNKDLEKIVKNLDKEDQKIQKHIQALEKKMVQVSGEVEPSETGKLVYQSDVSQSNNLHKSLQRTFEAMERFTMDSMKVYEELLQRCREEGLSRVHNHGS